VRISFDVDDTLVCYSGTPREQHLSWLWQWWYPEPLRLGTRDLMRELIRRGHTLWIYTTSHRPPGYLRGWFRSLGVRLEGVVNQDKHEQVVGRRGLSKYPPAFGIDLHIDDSSGVGEEGQRHGFRVLVVSPQDLEWAAKVLAASSGAS
jgi:hypothetical protein